MSKPGMSKKATQLHRRRFLKTALSAGAAVMAPTIIPSSALGRDGVAPSERIVVGGIGIGNRGTYDLGCFLEQKDVQFVAVCDVKEARRTAVKKMADQKYGNQSCLMYRDFRELLDRSDIDAVLIATGPNWHATMAMQRGQGRQGHVLREAVHEEHRAKPDPGATRCAARAACFRSARSGATCRTLRSPANWLAPASSASSRRSMPIRAA